MESCSDVLELTEILKDSHTVLENLLLSIFQPLVPAQKAALQGIIKQNKHDTFTLYYDILELVDCSTDNCTSLSRKVSEALKKTNLFGVSDNVLMFETRRIALSLKPPAVSKKHQERPELLKIFAGYYEQKCFSLAVLVGLRGVGKSDLVRHFLETINSQNPQSANIWINCEDSDNLKSTINDAANALLVEVKHDEDPILFFCTKLLPMIANAFLANSMTRPILVFDGISECSFEAHCKSIKECLASSNFLVIVTTSSYNQKSSSIQQENIVNVGRMRKEESVAFVKKYLPWENDKVGNDFCEYVDGYVCALNQAVAEIESKRLTHMDYSCQDYLQENRNHANRYRLKTKAALLSNNTVESRLSKVLSKIDGGNKNEGWDALKFVGLLAHTGKAPLSEVFLKKLYTAFYGDDCNFVSHVEELLTNFVLERKVEEYRMINFAKEFVVQLQEPNEQATILLCILQKVTLDQLDNLDLIHFKQIWLNCARVVTDLSCIRLVGENLFLQLDKAAMYLEAYNFAKEIVDMASSLKLDKNDSFLITAKINISLSLQRLGQHEESICVINEMYGSRKDDPSFKPTEQAMRALHSLANALYQRGKFSDALEVYDEVLNGRSRIVPMPYKDIKKTEANIASVLMETNQLTRGREMLEKVLSWQLENDSDAVYLTTYKIGYTYYKEKNYKKAKKLFLAAIKAFKSKGWEENVKSLTIECHIGLTEMELGNLENAKKHLEPVYELQKRKLGPDHEDTALTRNALENIKDAILRPREVCDLPYSTSSSFSPRTFSDLQRAALHIQLQTTRAKIKRTEAKLKDLKAEVLSISRLLNQEPTVTEEENANEDVKGFSN